MPTRRDFGHHSAVALVELRLRRDDVRADVSVLGHDRRRGLVARRLEPEDHLASAPRGSTFVTVSDTRTWDVGTWDAGPASGRDRLAQCRAGSGSGSFHMISASSRLSV